MVSLTRTRREHRPGSRSPGLVIHAALIVAIGPLPFPSGWAGQRRQRYLPSVAQLLTSSPPPSSFWRFGPDDQIAGLAALAIFEFGYS